MLYRYFPTTLYNNISVTDILKKLSFSDVFKQSNYVDIYKIKEGDTPESLALYLYKNSNYSSLILLLNGMEDRNNDWPYSYINMQNYLNRKYSGSSFYILDENIDFEFEEVSYIVGNTNTYQVLSTDRNFNKIVCEKINQGNLSSGDTVQIYDADDVLLSTVVIGRVVYEDKFSIHHFEVGGEYYEPKEEVVGEDSTLMEQYIAGDAEEYVVTNMHYENNLNDDKRDIILFRPEVIDEVINQLRLVSENDIIGQNILDSELPYGDRLG